MFIASLQRKAPAATAQVKHFESLEKENAVLKSKLSCVEGQAEQSPRADD
jgi:hypothetical protein